MALLCDIFVEHFLIYTLTSYVKLLPKLFWFGLARCPLKSFRGSLIPRSAFAVGRAAI